jgi:predicted aminopeptidase
MRRALSRTLLAGAAALAVGASGCSSLGYLAHVSAGQLGVLYARERLTPERIAGLSSDEQQGLRWLERAREYAASLGLARSTSYRHLIDRDRASALQVVVASPVDRLEPVTWWFPFVGRVAYRGYFDAERANRFAAGLAERGLDTYVRPALLYSTLGYFDDPIPRSALRWSVPDLCDVTIHELVHETIFVRGDVPYNEALASFISEQATLQLLADRARDRALAEQVFADRQTYASMIDALAGELRELYARAPSREQALAERARIFQRYQQEVFPAQTWRTQRYSDFGALALSNAFVVAEQTYSAALPCFARELAELGGDLRAFIARHREQPGHRAAVCQSS